MKRAALSIPLLWMALLFIEKQSLATELTYSVYVLGVPAAQASISVSVAETYRLALSFHVTGVAGLFVHDHLEEHTSGRFVNDRPVTTEYASTGILHGQDRDVAMTWRDNAPVITRITPPNTTDREDVPAAQLSNSVDTLDAIILLLRQTARTGRCEGAIHAYDGRRLQLLQSWTKGEEDVPPSSRSSFAGPALRCEFNDKTLAGFRVGAGRDDDLRDHRGTIWLGQVLPGTPRLPVRASVETRWLGPAMIYLTSASP